MSKRPFDTNQNKMTRNDRFTQMSFQEKLIEQKKREIQEKIDAKRREGTQGLKEKDVTVQEKSHDDKLLKRDTQDSFKPNINVFSNDGSFLDQFKQLKDKKTESKFKAFNKFKDKEREREREKDRDRGNERSTRINRGRSPSPLDRQKRSRFSADRTFEHQKITINTSFSNANTISSTSQFSQPIQSSQGFETPSPSLLGPHPSTLPQSISNVISGPASLPAEKVLQQTLSFPASAPINTLPQQNNQALASVTPQLVTATVTHITPNLQSVIQQPVGIAPNPSQNLVQVSETIPNLTSGISALQPVQSVIAQTLAPPNSLFTTNVAAEQIVQAPPQILMNIPPPQIIPQAQIVLTTPQTQNVLVSAPAGIITTVTLPPPVITAQNSCTGQNTIGRASVIPTVELTSIPPPNPIQPVLPPPGMTVNVPPPSLVTVQAARDVSQPPPNFVSQAPPLLPNMNMPPPALGVPSMVQAGFKDQLAGGAEFEAMAALARMVADCGPSVEDVVRQKKNQDPNLWFLFHRESAAYRQYTGLLEQYKREKEDMKEEVKPKRELEEMYEPEMALEEDERDQMDDNYVEIKEEMKNENDTYSENKQKKRKSRWGEKDPNIKPPGVIPVIVPTISPIRPVTSGPTTLLSKVTRQDPALLRYVAQTYGSTNLDEEDWKKAEDNYKIHLLYQDMIKKREELERLHAQGKNKYEYDSDEETEGGTWEHKLREKEMQATEIWATELTKQAEGKHHIGDFLPPEELKRFLEKSSAVKEGRQPNFSDYKEFKIKEDNIGFKMLQKLGWTEGEGLGQNSAGIVEPINKGAPRENTQGLGLNIGEATEDEDEYESYRKRMMLAYRFRPNPMNNPRRPYY
ncbi:bromodomain-containing protein 4 isoform X2 [Sitophilus oryzae]|uniref:Bromodomain-containing protein 4 isoform X2 n=1 Tax=Sitophilus oryzae TaxID=7048 RepID=A0A6J2YK68_SITOR|nr:bromodomain-containing protein 4 isoform X2 [Sitophilus oryzae]